MNTHADHTMVSAFTTAAFHLGRFCPKRFPALGPIHVADAASLLPTLPASSLPNRPAPLPTPWTVTLDVSPPAAIANSRAFRAHTSQAPLMERTFQANFESRAGTEVYALAATPHPQPCAQQTHRPFRRGL